MRLRGRTLTVVPAFVLVVLAMPSAAFGQATRTWVEGASGDDSFPCSRTAPCKTFAGAVNKTAAGGEINIINGGGYGGMTINKSLTVRARGGTGGVLVSGVNAIVVNAGASDRVTIDGLDINGIGTGAQTSLSGIKVISAGRVNIVNSEIYRFKVGVAVIPTSASTRVVLRNNHIYDNGIGVFNAPGNSLVTGTVVTARDNLINDNVCGVSSGAFGANASTPTTTDCGTAAFAAIDEPTGTRLWRNAIHDNEFGVFGRGANSTTELGHNEVTGNTSFGLRRIDLAVMRSTSPATNVFSNPASDAPNGAAIALG